MGRSRVVAIVIAALLLWGSTLRESRAAEDLSKAPPEQRVAALSRMLRGSQQEAARVAFLVHRLTPDDQDLLPEVLKWATAKEPHVRINAATALRRLGSSSEKVRSAVLRLRSDRDQYTVFESHLTAAVLGFEDRQLALQAAEKLALEFGSEAASFTSHQFLDMGAVEQVYTVLENRDREGNDLDSEFAERDWRQIAPIAIPRLIALLKSDDLAMRLRALRRLAWFGPAADSAVSAILPLAAESDEKILAVVCEALGQIGASPDQCAPVLKDWLKDSTPEVRWRAAVALARLRRDADLAIPVLLTAATSDRDSSIRRLCVVAIGHFGEQGAAAVPSLIGLIDAEQPLPDAAVLALSRIGKPAVGQLVAFARSHTGVNRLKALEAISDWSDPAARDELLKACDDETEELRTAAFVIAQRCAKLDDRFEAAILKSIADSQGTPRAQFLLSLAAFPPRSDDAIPALSSLIDDPDELNARFAIDALAAMGPQAAGAIPAIKRSSARALVQDAVPMAIERISPGDVETFLSLLGNENRSTRHNALISLRRIKPDSPELLLAIRNVSETGTGRLRMLAAATYCAIRPDEVDGIARLRQSVLDSRWALEEDFRSEGEFCVFDLFWPVVAADRSAVALHDLATQWQNDSWPRCADACRKILVIQAEDPEFLRLASLLGSDDAAYSIYSRVSAATDLRAAAVHRALLDCEDPGKTGAVEVWRKLSR